MAQPRLRSHHTFAAGFLLAAASIALIGLLALPTRAGSTSQSVTYENGTLIVSGSSNGDHVVLGMTDDRNHFEISGYVPGRLPSNCASADQDRLVRCGTGGVDGMEVDTNGGGDFVEVSDALAVPLTIRLGMGSDKFIGNGERDTCYPGGSRRNRCIGGAGDDVCITGPRNSDCVGGPGEDYCQHSTGSDGCWGGPGDDVCRMGPGQDGCHGEGGNDRLYGGADPDQLYGGEGNDYCDGGPGRGKSHTCERGPQH
jgi:Ca2+-binding RTX toxin-like protein